MQESKTRNLVKFPNFARHIAMSEIRCTCCASYQLVIATKVWTGMAINITTVTRRLQLISQIALCFFPGKIWLQIHLWRIFGMFIFISSSFRKWFWNGISEFPIESVLEISFFRKLRGIFVIFNYNSRWINSKFYISLVKRL